MRNIDARSESRFVSSIIENLWSFLKLWEFKSPSQSMLNFMIWIFFVRILFNISLIDMIYSRSLIRSDPFAFLMRKLCKRRLFSCNIFYAKHNVLCYIFWVFFSLNGQKLIQIMYVKYANVVFLCHWYLCFFLFTYFYCYCEKIKLQENGKRVAYCLKHFFGNEYSLYRFIHTLLLE